MQTVDLQQLARKLLLHRLLQPQMATHLLLLLLLHQLLLLDQLVQPQMAKQLLQLQYCFEYRK